MSEFTPGTAAWIARRAADQRGGRELEARVTALEEGGGAGGGGGGGGFVVASHLGTINLDAAPGTYSTRPMGGGGGFYGIGPLLEFEVGESGYVLLGFTARIWQPPSSHYACLALDGTSAAPSGDQQNISNSGPLRWSAWVGASAGRWCALFNHSSDMWSGLPGLMARLEPGEHTLEYAYYSAGGGGFLQDPLLFAQTL